MSELLSGIEDWFAADATPTLGRLLAAILIVAAALFVAHLISATLGGARKRHVDAAPGIYIAEKLSRYAIIVLGLFLALATLGVDITSLTVFAGAVGVGLGLGLQGIVKEFFSGLVIIFDQLVQVGDFVELDNGVRGEIVEVTSRATRIRTNDGVSVVFPNSKLLESQVTNWTHLDRPRRFRIPFEVAENADKGQVRDVVTAAAQAVPFTAPDSEGRRTQVWLTGFGDDSLKFDLVVWPTPDAIRRPTSMQAAYTWAIDDALRGASIERAHKQLDLSVLSLFGREGDNALHTLGLPPEHRGSPEPATAKASRNDAAAAVSEEARVAARERESEKERKARD